MIDSHYHLDESIVSLENLIEDMDRADISKTALIPAICPELKDLPALVQPFLPLFRRLLHGPPGLLHKMVSKVYSGAVKKDGTVDLMGTSYELFPEPDNDVVIEAVKKYPDRFVGYCFVNPATQNNTAEIAEKYLAEPGIVGIKAHPFWHDYPIESLKDVAAICEEKARPLLVHMGVGDRGDFAYLHKNFPRLKVIYAHLGIPYSHAVCEEAKHNDNVYVDMSNTEYSDGANLKMCVDKIGPEKILFGSDGPYMIAENGKFDYNPILDIVKTANLTDKQIDKIGNENFDSIVNS